MGTEAGDEKQSSMPKLSPATMPMHSPESSGMLTPPLLTSASVPFRWEDEPGKPKPCASLITLPDSSKTDFSHKCLELPPRLLFMDHATVPNANNITKLSSVSPTTVLEGPCVVGRLSRFQITSLFSKGSECYGFFHRSFSPERDHDHFGAMVLCNSKSVQKEKGVFYSWRKKWLKSKKKNREVSGCSYVFPSSVDRYGHGECSREEEEAQAIAAARSGSFTSVSLARPLLLGDYCSMEKQRSQER